MSPKSGIKSIEMGPGGIKMEAKSIKMRPWLLWEALGPPGGSRSGPGEHRVPDFAGIFIIIAQNGDLLGTHFWHRPNVQRFFGVFLRGSKNDKNTIFRTPPKSTKSGPMLLLCKD